MRTEIKKFILKAVVKKVLFSLLILLIILGFFFKSFIMLFEGPKDIYSLPKTSFKNSYVTGDFSYVIDVFANRTVTDKGKQKSSTDYYIVALYDGNYIAIRGKSKIESKMNTILNQTYAYLTYETDDIPDVINLTGSLQKMNSKELYYYMDWFNRTQFLGDISESELEEIALPYILYIDNIGIADPIFIYSALVVCIALFIYILYSLIMFLSGQYLSQITKFIRQTNQTEDLVEADFVNAIRFGHIWIGDKHSYFLQGAKAGIVNNENLIWAYMHEYTHRLNGIPVYFKRSLELRTKMVKPSFSVKARKKDILNALNYYDQAHPHIITYYNCDINKMYNKNLQAFLQLSAAQEADLEDVLENETN